jgi:hypothetical protein
MTTCLPRELTTDKHVILPVYGSPRPAGRHERAALRSGGQTGRPMTVADTKCAAPW